MEKTNFNEFGSIAEPKYHFFRSTQSHFLQTKKPQASNRAVICQLCPVFLRKGWLFLCLPLTSNFVTISKPNAGNIPMNT